MKDKKHNAQHSLRCRGLSHLTPVAVLLAFAHLQNAEPIEVWATSASTEQAHFRNVEEMTVVQNRMGGMKTSARGSVFAVGA